MSLHFIWGRPAWPRRGGHHKCVSLRENRSEGPPFGGMPLSRRQRDVESSILCPCAIRPKHVGANGDLPLKLYQRCPRIRTYGGDHMPRSSETRKQILWARMPITVLELLDLYDKDSYQLTKMPYWPSWSRDWGFLMVTLASSPIQIRRMNDKISEQSRSVVSGRPRYDEACKIDLSDISAVRGEGEVDSPTADQLERLRRVSEILEDASAEEILRWAIDTFYPSLAMATAFGPEGCVILSILAELQPKVRVFNLDTGYQFPETLQLRDRIAQKYGIEVILAQPELSVEEYEKRHGGPVYKSNPDQCCFDRKVRVLKRMVVGYRAWIRDSTRSKPAPGECPDCWLGQEIWVGKNQPACSLDQKPGVAKDHG